MSEIRSLPHEISKPEMFRLFMALKSRIVVWLILIELPLFTIVFLIAKAPPWFMINGLLGIPILNALIGIANFSLTAFTPLSRASRISRTYSFRENEYSVTAANGQTGVIPYASLHSVQGLGDGTILKVAPLNGHWIRPSHFGAPHDYRQVLEWLAESRRPA